MQVLRSHSSLSSSPRFFKSVIAIGPMSMLEFNVSYIKLMSEQSPSTPALRTLS